MPDFWYAFASVSMAIFASMLWSLGRWTDERRLAASNPWSAGVWLAYEAGLTMMFVYSVFMVILMLNTATAPCFGG